MSRASKKIGNVAKSKKDSALYLALGAKERGRSMSRRRNNQRRYYPEKNRRQQSQGPRGKRPGGFRRFVKKVFTNRREPSTHYASGSDIVMNLKEWWYTLNNRVPKGASLTWRKGKIIGHTSRNRWP